MVCKNCGKEIEEGLKICPECNTDNSAVEEKQSQWQTDFIQEKGQKAKELAEKGIENIKDFKSMTKEEQKEVVDQTKEKAKDFLNKEKGNYKNFKNLSTKQKIIRIAVPVIILAVIIGIFSGKSYKNDEETAINYAILQVDSQIYGGADVEIFGAECVEKDGKGRYIVTVSSQRNRFETRWAVLVTLHPDGEHYKAIANYHGDHNGFTQEEWVEEYQNNPEYGWKTKVEKS